MTAAARFVSASTLALSRAPAAELAGAALDAQAAAGIAEQGAEFIIVAIPAGSDNIAAAAEAAEAAASAALDG